MKVTVIPITNGVLGRIPEEVVKGLVDFEIYEISGDYPDNSTIKIGQNTKKSPRNFRRLVVTQTDVKNRHQHWCEKLSKKC